MVASPGPISRWYLRRKSDGILPLICYLEGYLYTYRRHQFYPYFDSTPFGQSEMVHVRVVTLLTRDPRPNLLPNPPRLENNPLMGLVRGFISRRWHVVWVHGATADTTLPLCLPCFPVAVG